MLVTPVVTVAVAAAPVPPPPVNVTVGGDVYPDPPVGPDNGCGVAIACRATDEPVGKIELGLGLVIFVPVAKYRTGFEMAVCAPSLAFTVMK